MYLQNRDSLFIPIRPFPGRFDTVNDPLAQEPLPCPPFSWLTSYVYTCQSRSTTETTLALLLLLKAPHTNTQAHQGA